MAPETDRPLPDSALPRTDPARELTLRFLSALEHRLESISSDGRTRLLRAMRHAGYACSRCEEACHIYVGSGQDPRYRPGLRADILRRIYSKYAKGGGAAARWRYRDLELNDTAVAALGQMSYECNLCERCAQSCRDGDHALVARELRAIFAEIGMRPPGVQDHAGVPARDRIASIDAATSRRSGVEVHTPWDVEDADVLLVQPASIVHDWPENVGAVALLLTCAGIKWTLSSALADDDPVHALEPGELSEIGRRHDFEATRLRAGKIVVGESGAAYGALCGGAAGTVSRESVIVLLRDIVRAGRVRFNPLRNDFPVTLHDPCRLTRHGVTEPQREILRGLCPQFREMDPWAENNYCCGGGGGLVDIKEAWNWRVGVAGRKKMEQIIDAFPELPDPETRKYVCAPCGSCKTQLQDLIAEHAPKSRVLCGGLAELVANAIEDVPPGFLQWESS